LSTIPTKFAGSMWGEYGPWSAQLGGFGAPAVATGAESAVNATSNAAPASEARHVRPLMPVRIGRPGYERHRADG
jgi:hypothetical protein